jgi:hypothetical protein
MKFADARIISAGEARSLVEPPLSRFLGRGDIEIELDEALSLGLGSPHAVVALPDGAVIDGDLTLDWEQATFDGKRFRGVLALGSLTVKRDILNCNWDGGPFLVVLGALGARHVFKRGAPMIVLGPITMAGTIYCEYNHGVFRALGGVKAQGIVIDDHSHHIVEPVDAPMAVLNMTLPGMRDPRELLLPEFFSEEDEYGHFGLVDDGAELLKERIRAGKPIFRPDAPHGNG